MTDDLDDLTPEEKAAAAALADLLDGEEANMVGSAHEDDGATGAELEFAALLRNTESFDLDEIALRRGRNQLFTDLDEQQGVDSIESRTKVPLEPGRVHWLAWAPLPLAAAAALIFLLRPVSDDDFSTTGEPRADTTSALPLEELEPTAEGEPEPLARKTTRRGLVEQTPVQAETVASPSGVRPSRKLVELQARRLAARLGADGATPADPNAYEREMRAYRGQLLAVLSEDER